MSGLSRSVIESRNALILSQIEAHAPNKERYTLIAKVVNVGVALLVYGRDDGVGRRACDVQTQWAGCGPAYMGNKGAVGVRFRVPGEDGGVGEVYTYVPFSLQGRKRWKRSVCSCWGWKVRVCAPYRARAQERVPHPRLPSYRRLAALPPAPRNRIEGADDDVRDFTSVLLR